ncbi:hypothetical protein BJF79_01980 [Actinomadura sp. CNU-125]|nr:hypothetical protein BJF79_01980 [Actinomadura sp. CNU-125]
MPTDGRRPRGDLEAGQQDERAPVQHALQDAEQPAETIWSDSSCGTRGSRAPWTTNSGASIAAE